MLAHRFYWLYIYFNISELESFIGLVIHCFFNIYLLALLYNLRVYIQIFDLVGGTSRRRVSPYKSEYLYTHEYLLNKILVS